MLGNIMKFFSKSENSKKIARERLKLVLINDRANLSPQFLDMLKSEIIKVVNNYMEIDEENMDIQLSRTRGEGNRIVPALLASIPIKNVKNSGR